MAALPLAIVLTVIASSSSNIGKAFQKEASRHLPPLDVGNSKVLDQYAGCASFKRGVFLDVAGTRQGSFDSSVVRSFAGIESIYAHSSSLAFVRQAVCCRRLRLHSRPFRFCSRSAASGWPDWRYTVTLRYRIG